MTPPTLTAAGAHALVLPAVSGGGRRRVTHVSARLLESLDRHVRAGCDTERSAALASLLALVTDVDADDQDVTEPHLTGGAPIDCPTVPALGTRVRLHLLADGAFLAAFADEAAPDRSSCRCGPACGAGPA
ncbi:hypothetical protein AB0K09_20335 [Streptomyces sp. NPDC049577]|uniref:hypothetical protein n=1 Tax=Streptomyces sp. NPDC049577 TaxID=3155153 RepID=UPI00342FF486